MIHGVYLINLSYVTQHNELYLKMIDLLKNIKDSILLQCTITQHYRRNNCNSHALRNHAEHG